MTSCVLSPYGTYDDHTTCQVQSSCGWGWECGADGVPIQVEGGKFATAKECLCWTCTADPDEPCVTDLTGYGEYATKEDCASTCIPGYECLPEGPTLTTTGTKATPDECKYECDGNGGKQETTGDHGVLYDAANCFECSGGHEYTPVEAGTEGRYDGTDELGCLYWCGDGTGEAAAVGDLDSVRASVNNQILADNPDVDVNNLDLGSDEYKPYVDNVAKRTAAEVKCYQCRDAVDQIGEGEFGGIDASCSAVGGGGQGTFETMEECETDTTAMCGWQYGCPPGGPELTVSGTKAAPDECKYECDGEGGKIEAADGVLYDAALCYECTGEHEYTPVAAGIQGKFDGTHHLGCRYWCGAGENEGAAERVGQLVTVHRSVGNKYKEDNNIPPDTDEDLNNASSELLADMLLYGDEDGNNQDVALYNEYADSTARKTAAEVTCYQCRDASDVELKEGEVGGNTASCTVAGHGGHGLYASMEACETDTNAMCGWGYGCEGENCALKVDAPRGQTEKECELDSTEKCGWKYDCMPDAKYACVDGVSCVAIPSDEVCQDEGLTCYETVSECLAGSTCTKTVGICEEESPITGRWLLTRSTNATPIFGTTTTDPFLTFTEDRTGSEGYVWYTSDKTDPSGIPIIELGLLEEIDDTGRNIYLKFRGRHYWGDTLPESDSDVKYTDFWSSISGTAGTWNQPVAIRIATFPADDTTCFTLDSIDLGYICGDNNKCVSRTTPSGAISNIVTLVLQREELCAEQMWIGRGESGGKLVGDCPACDIKMMDGDWMMQRINGNAYRPMYGENDPLEDNYITFSQNETVDVDDFLWFTSNLTDDTGLPILEIAFKEVFGEASNPGGINVYTKFRGRMYLTNFGGTFSTEYRDFWSREQEDAGFSYLNPGAILIAELPKASCFELDSVDLTAICGTGDCAARDPNISAENIVLQRRELCEHNARMIEYAGANGVLDASNCPATSCIDVSPGIARAFNIKLSETTSTSGETLELENVNLVSSRFGTNGFELAGVYGDFGDYSVIVRFTNDANGIVLAYIFVVALDGAVWETGQQQVAEAELTDDNLCMVDTYLNKVTFNDAAVPGGNSSIEVLS